MNPQTGRLTRSLVLPRNGPFLFGGTRSLILRHPCLSKLASIGRNESVRRFSAKREINLRGSMMNLPEIRNHSPSITFLFTRRNSSGNGERIVKTPHMADSITEGELARFEKKIGESVKENEVVAIIETDKVDIEVSSPVNGTIAGFFVNPGDVVKVGSDLFKVRLGEAQPTVPLQTPTTSKPSEELKKPGMGGEKVGPKDVSKPAKIEQESPIEPSRKPSDETEPLVSEKRPTDTLTETHKPAEALSSLGERRVKMSRMRLRIAERLKESQNTAASLTTFNEVDMS
jgi:2-oxoglutarate dehydrogenase E2 component (dihydrolipoamide succinyltransferase)